MFSIFILWIYLPVVLSINYQTQVKDFRLVDLVNPLIVTYSYHCLSNENTNAALTMPFVNEDLSLINFSNS
jgi:hypothetical protein